MFPLTGQVQRASDTAKGCVVRLGAVSAVSFADTETTFPELEERLAKTVSLLRGVKVADLEGAAERRVEMKFGERTIILDGSSYVTGFVLPNFYFHVATAYDLLRYKGLKIGKADYIGMDGLEAKAEA